MVIENAVASEITFLTHNTLVAIFSDDNGELGRVDSGTSSGYGLRDTLDEAAMSVDEVLRTSVKIFDPIGYIAFSTDVPDHEIGLWQQALDRIKASGRYDQLVEDYLHSR